MEQNLLSLRTITFLPSLFCPLILLLLWFWSKLYIIKAKHAHAGFFSGRVLRSVGYANPAVLQVKIIHEKALSLAAPITLLPDGYMNELLPPHADTRARRHIGTCE